MTYHIRLERNTLRFAAAHFTTSGGECEPLHGHNYDVMVEITGTLTPDSWVLDFSDAKRLIAAICKEVDHKFILQGASQVLGISRSGESYELTHGDKRYVIPASDVVALPIDNSTAERLAQWFAARISTELADRGVTNVGRIAVGIEEAPGQAGWYALSPLDNSLL